MRVFQFIEEGKSMLELPIPNHLQGKYVRITVEECAPEDGTPLHPSENNSLKQKEEAMMLLDKLRTQLEVWDM